MSGFIKIYFSESASIISIMARRIDLRRAFASELESILKDGSGLASRIVDAAQLFEFESKLTGADVTRLKKNPDDVDLGKFESCVAALERLGRSNLTLKGAALDLIDAEGSASSLLRTSDVLLPIDEALGLAEEALRGAKPRYAAYEALSRSWSSCRHTKQGCNLRQRAEKDLRELLSDWGESGDVLKARIVRADSARITEQGEVPGAPDPDARDEDFKNWYARLDELTRTVVNDRSRLSQFVWPHPYRNGWVYADREIEAMIDRDEGPGYEATCYCRGNKVTPDFFRGRKHAYLFDPESFEDLQSTRFIFRPESEPYRIPRRFAHIVPRALFPCFSGRQTYFDSELARMDVNLTKVNVAVRIGRTTFSTTIASHYVTGHVMYDDRGNKDFDGFSHICQNDRFLLLHSQAASNSIAVSCLAITKDHRLAIILRGGHENVFGHASWRPPVTGSMSIEDFTLNGETEGAFADAVRKAVKRIATFELLGGEDPRKIEDDQVEFVGYANAVANGKRPCAFAAAHLPYTSRELQELNPGVFMRFHDLVPDNHRISGLELLETDSYAEAETLRANVMLYIKYRARYPDAPSTY